MLYFGAFGFDVRTGRLTGDGDDLALGRTAARVLAVLLEHHPHAVPQETILRTVWPSHVVDRGAVKGYISDLRAILGDDPRAPRFIASEDGGYRFLAAIAAHSPAERDARRAAVVGRDEPLQMLRDNLDRARGGRRRIVFVTGEAGIGKTTAVELFLEEAAAARHLVTGRGQCVEHSGCGMAYLPILEALERICRSDAGARVLAVLRQHAPTWLVQLPTSLAPDDRGELERSAHAATQERQFRELARALELLTVDDPLALWLEDLHWCDPETVALLSFLARRTEPARLCIIGTYRPVDVIVHQHRIKALAQELHAQGVAAMVLLPFLPPSAIEAYVRQRFATGAGLPIRDLTEALRSRTEGNPLFMVRVLDYAVAQGIVAPDDGAWRLTTTAADLARLFPASLRDLIGQQLAHLTDDERQVLEAASAVGEEFALAEVAAALEMAPDAVDRCCETLARQRQLLVLGEPEHWPDGTLTLRARFVHALYRQAVHEQVLPTRPRGTRGSRRERPPPTAPTPKRSRRSSPRISNAAATWHGRSSITHKPASTRCATRRFVSRWSSTPPRCRCSRVFRKPRNVPRRRPGSRWRSGSHTCTRPYSSPEVERAYARARELCDRLGEAGPLFPTLYGLWGYYLTRGQYRTSRPVAERLLLLATQVDDVALRLPALQALGLNEYYQGEFAASDRHLEQSLALYDPHEHRGLVFQYGNDPAVVALSIRALTLWMLGCPDRALRASVDAVTLARRIGYVPSLAMALHCESLAHGLRGEWSEARRRSEEAANLAVEHELPFLLGSAMTGLGMTTSALGQPEDALTVLRNGLDVYGRTGSRLGFTHVMIAIAEAQGKIGQYEEALRALAEAEAFGAESGEEMFAAEVARVRGVVLLRQAADARPASRPRRKPGGRTGAVERPPDDSAVVEAEASLLRALSIAQEQGARGWELRAATSLAALWRGGSKSHDGQELLAGILGRFTEGADTADVRNAQTLLAVLG